jgi:hypothetical protein
MKKTASFGDKSNRSNYSDINSMCQSEADDILSSQGPILDIKFEDI